MIGRRVPRRRVVLLPLLGGQLVVQALHSLLPAAFVGDVRSTRGATDLLASRFHGRLGYAWWFERGKIATLWTHLRSMNLAERYPPTAELAQGLLRACPGDDAASRGTEGASGTRGSRTRSASSSATAGDRASRSTSGGPACTPPPSTKPRSAGRARRSSLLERTGDQWELNNCRLQIAMARYRLGDLAGAAEDAKAAWDAGLDIGDPQARRDRAGGVGEIHRRTGPRTGDPRRARTLGSEDVLTIASVLQAEGVRLLGVDEPSSAVGAFEESQRLFRRAGMKNAGVSPIRPWLLTALLRDAEATPRGDRRQALVRRARSVARQASRRARASTGTTCRTSCVSARASPL